MTRSPSSRLLMGRRFKKSVAAVLLAVSMLATTPHSARAADEDNDHYDARVQGYDPKVELKGGSTGFTWIVMVFLAAVCVSVIFIDAKRSHLD